MKQAWPAAPGEGPSPLRKEEIKKMENKIMKISRLWECKCGWTHITQGPGSCWVCMETLSFARWQTGKEAPVNPAKVVVHRRSDFRDRTKEQVVIAKDGPRFTDGPREMCWPEEPGMGRYERGFLNGNVGR